ncbi:hypothetical protein [Paradevosia shaoguanensis]|uniref:hypothetical protein n=1 Tax=Paradevosia shaoguanensis TaxID=1335043 RepID=UPI0019343407|nr:hypothetical protein [Paradevosia shaoguanensis]
MADKYRDVLVIDYDRFNGVLVYREREDRSMILLDNSAGTNIPWRWLEAPDGESYGTIRSLPVDTSMMRGGAFAEYRGQTVTVLLVGPRFFWPACALSTSIDEWFEEAELPAPLP